MASRGYNGNRRPAFARPPTNRLPMVHRRLAILTLLILWILAAPLAAEEQLQFDKDISPILEKKCLRCHKPETRRAELDLSSLASLLKGGESGELLSPGKPDESLLVDMVRGELMPPEDEPQLTPKEIELIERWVQEGAHGESASAATAKAITNHDIEPLLLLRCGVCHGLRKQEGGLDLRSRESMLRGGKSGPAIRLGAPKQSLLLKRIHAGEMPPRAQMIRAGVKPMTSSEIETLSEWIRLGAPTIEVRPDVADGKADPLVTDEDRQFWAFRAPVAAQPPAVKNQARVRNPIDAFLLAKLESASLTFSQPASPTELARRLHFDLTGLPPTPEELQAFLADTRPDAYERLIDRLLASPRYGERWGRYWLDLAGYADSEGKRSADPIRPYAYKYRDYVIRSLNADKPYSRFLLEQLAGDELLDYQNMKVLSAEAADNLVATGFLRMAPDGTGSDIVNSVPERLEVIADEIDIFSSTVLALTVKCARCHSHKYDPIPQRDYYRLAAVFKGAYDEHDWLKPSVVPGQSKVTKPGRVLPLGTQAEIDSVRERNKSINAEIKALEQRKQALADSIRREHFEGELATLPVAIRADVKQAFAAAKDARNDVQTYLVKKFSKQLNLSDAAVKKADGYRRAATELDRQIKSLKGELGDTVKIRALWDRGEPSPTYIYVRGDYKQVGRLVGPGVPSVLTDGQSVFRPEPPFPGAQATGRRRELARWLTQPDHPLTARVMVNRVWKRHFGRGIVGTVDNFGKLGERPSHPQLLDWLAVRFVEQGWSLKAMHRLMLTSTAYRQTSRTDAARLTADPENRLISRMPMRRLDAEEVRDTLLRVAGRLSESPFGRPDAVAARKDGLNTSQALAGRSWRRSIYVRQRRKEIPTILETFDLPQMNPSCQVRVNSIVAQQALHLMNDPLVRELSDFFARRVQAETADEQSRLQFAYQVAYGRHASEQELQIGRDSLAALRQIAKQETPADDAASSEQKAWSALCHTLLNAAEFLYVD